MFDLCRIESKFDHTHPHKPWPVRIIITVLRLNSANISIPTDARLSAGRATWSFSGIDDIKYGLDN